MKLTDDLDSETQRLLKIYACAIFLINPFLNLGSMNSKELYAHVFQEQLETGSLTMCNGPGNKTDKQPAAALLPLSLSLPFPVLRSLRPVWEH